MRRIGAVLILAVAVGACGVPGATDATSTLGSEPPTTTPLPRDGLDVIVPPNAQGNYPGDVIVSCSNGQFPISALEEIRPLEEADPGGVGDAIAAFLANEEGQQWPQEGWQILHRTDDEIQLVAKGDDGRLTFMYVTDDGDGWSWAGASLPGDPCELEFVVPDHLNAVDWRLDPDGGELAAASTDLHVVLNERECVGGQEIGDRLIGPQVVMTETQVFVAFAAEQPDGDAFDCQGNPDMPFVVELPEPLGDREIVEGFEIGIDLADYVD
jgi:hypothetical protein